MLIGLFSHVRFSFSLWRKTHVLGLEHRFLSLMSVLSILDATTFPSQAPCLCMIPLSNTLSNVQFLKTGLGIEVFFHLHHPLLSLLITPHPKISRFLTSPATKKSRSKVNGREHTPNRKWKVKPPFSASQINTETETER